MEQCGECGTMFHNCKECGKKIRYTPVVTKSRDANGTLISKEIDPDKHRYCSIACNIIYIERESGSSACSCSREEGTPHQPWCRIAEYEMTKRS